MPSLVLLDADDNKQDSLYSTNELHHEPCMNVRVNESSEGNQIATNLAQFATCAPQRLVKTPPQQILVLSE